MNQVTSLPSITFPGQVQYNWLGQGGHLPQGSPFLGGNGGLIRGSPSPETLNQAQRWWALGLELHCPFLAKLGTTALRRAEVIENQNQ